MITNLLCVKAEHYLLIAADYSGIMTTDDILNSTVVLLTPTSMRGKCIIYIYYIWLG